MTFTDSAQCKRIDFTCRFGVFSPIIILFTVVGMLKFLCPLEKLFPGNYNRDINAVYFFILQSEAYT